MNQAKLMGNLGGEPEIKQGSNGKPFALFSVATQESWKDRDTDEDKKDVQWHQIAVFEPALVDYARDNLHKGSFVTINGRIRNSQWDDGSGQKRYSSQIVLSGPKAVLCLWDDQQKQSAGRGSR